MRGGPRRSSDLVKVSLREFGWEPATIATLRHSTLPWFDGYGPEIDLVAGPLLSTRDLGARDRLSLTAQFAAHQAFLGFAGITDDDFRPDDWVVARKRGHDCRLIRVAGRNGDPSVVPPVIVLAQQFAEAINAPDVEVLRQSWTRAESIYAEIERKLGRDAAADLRWLYRAAMGDVVAPGADALRHIWQAAGETFQYADDAVRDSIRAYATCVGEGDVVELGTEFPIHRYSAIAAISRKWINSPSPERVVAEGIATELGTRRRIILVPISQKLDQASQRVVAVASTLRTATWLFQAAGGTLPPSRSFVLCPRLATHRLLEERLTTVNDRRTWIETFVTSPAFSRYLDSGELPPDESAVAAVGEPKRSYIAALALLGTRIPRDLAERFLSQFLFDHEVGDLAVPNVTVVDQRSLVFVSDQVRELCARHIPPASRPALCRVAATLAGGRTAAELLIEAGDAGEGIALFETVSFSDAAECAQALGRLPKSMLTPALAERLATALVDCGRYRDALVVAPMLSERPREYVLARVERRRGDYQTALTRLERLEDRDLNADLLRCELLRLLGRHSDAHAALEQLQPNTGDERIRIAYERSVLALDTGTEADQSWCGSDHYLSFRYRTYRALQGGDFVAAEALAEESIGMARCQTERIDAWLDRVYASFSSGEWEQTRALAMEALTVIDEAQGDRASAGILLTLAYLAADDARWEMAGHLTRRVRQQYQEAKDLLRLTEVDLLTAHSSFCRGRMAEAYRLALTVYGRPTVGGQIREAAALIADEIDWIEQRALPLRSTGQSGNRELDDRHRLLCQVRGLEGRPPQNEFNAGLAQEKAPTPVTRSEKLKLFRFALATGRRSLAESIAAELAIDMVATEKTVTSPEVELLTIAATAPYPFAADTFGEMSWSFAARNRLGHWSVEGEAMTGADFDHIAAGDAPDWIRCSDHELLYLKGCSSWTAASREAVAAVFRTRAENHRLRRLVELDQLDGHAPPTQSVEGMIGQSAAIRELFGLLERIARRDVVVCIQGESGTGKELVARALHRASIRRTKPFTAVNCAALPEALVESELFGHCRGAFTGADRDRPGLIEMTDGGTLFLDEIGEMPPAAQAKLLRFLQDGEFRRVGEASNRSADVRVITATNRKLEVAVEEGRFREDLYYRIRGVEVVLPPLRERGSDVILLADHFLQDERRRHRSGPVALSPEAESILRSYRWPGNVRELQNTIRAAHAMAGDAKEVQIEHLPERLRSVAPARTVAGSYQDAVTRFRRDLIEKSLVQAAGNQNRAAALLKMSRQALAYQIRELGIMVRKTSPPRARL